jgi:pyruvate kinase
VVGRPYFFSIPRIASNSGIFEAAHEGARLLLDDGKLVLRLVSVAPDRMTTIVEVGGTLSNNKGLNVPDMVLPLAALTEKDRSDLAFAVEQGADWIALSFVQRPEDLMEARRLIGGKAALHAKIEKPSAISPHDEIVEQCDGVMVARGDLGVELPPEDVPGLQKKIVRLCRRLGKPVVVATQMLESMVHAPAPTRAEASDVATAVYDGADAVMLSAETASGEYPLEAVGIMDRIITRVEHDPLYRPLMDADHAEPEATAADAITAAAAQVAVGVRAAAIVTFTTSGSTTLRAAGERPQIPIVALSPNIATGRKLSVAWGIHCIVAEDARDPGDMVERACRLAFKDGFAKAGRRVIIVAGVPLGTPGATNMLRIAFVGSDAASE